jgi:hypothetical protein
MTPVFDSLGSECYGSLHFKLTDNALLPTLQFVSLCHSSLHPSPLTVPIFYTPGSEWPL